MQQNIQIDGPKTITLSPTTIGLVIKGMYMLPFGEVVNAINEVQGQLMAAKPADADKGAAA